jgi:hypothetical protein
MIDWNWLVRWKNHHTPRTSSVVTIDTTYQSRLLLLERKVLSLVERLESLEHDNRELRILIGKTHVPFTKIKPMIRTTAGITQLMETRSARAANLEHEIEK